MYNKTASRRSMPFARAAALLLIVGISAAASAKQNHTYYDVATKSSSGSCCDAAGIGCDSEGDILSMDGTLLTQDIKPDDDRSVLYVAQLIFPTGFLPLLASTLAFIGGGEIDLPRRLGASKIGQAGSWAHFLQKMASLRTHISFARLRWVAILHPYDALQAEQAMHFVYRRFHVAGEWYDMNEQKVNNLLARFPNCQVLRGTTQFPQLQQVAAVPDSAGWIYLAKYDWPQVEYDAIANIHDTSQNADFKWVCQQMLSTKIGSTVDLRDRGVPFVWACCFARVRYDAFYVPYDPIQQRGVRYQEQLLHDRWRDFHGGVGEWFAVPFGYDPTPSTPGLWQRAGNIVHIHHQNLLHWIIMGWVRATDIILNIASGHFIVHGIVWTTQIA